MLWRTLKTSWLDEDPNVKDSMREVIWMLMNPGYSVKQMPANYATDRMPYSVER